MKIRVVIKRPFGNIELEGESLDEIIEGLESEKEVIILTDLDRKGRELYHILKSGLERRGVRVLEKPRKIIKRLGYTHIEGINIDEDNF